MCQAIRARGRALEEQCRSTTAQPRDQGETVHYRALCRQGPKRAATVKASLVGRASSIQKTWTAFMTTDAWLLTTLGKELNNFFSLLDFPNGDPAGASCTLACS